MSTQIELDDMRLIKYQFVKNNLAAVAEKFRHGDILIKEINQVLEDIQTDIDNAVPTSFTKQDFNDILDLRNSVLMPIMQNASFARNFDYYSALKDANPVPVEPTPDVIETKVEDQVVLGILLSSIATTTTNSVITKTVKTSFSSGMVVEVSTNEYSGGVTFKTDTVKFVNGVEVYKVRSLISGVSVMVTMTNYTDGLPVSETTTTYNAGVVTGTETITL